MYTLKQERNGTKAYEETSTDEKSVFNSHSNEFVVNTFYKGRQDKLPTMLPKLNKKPHKARFITNYSSCTTTECFKLITSFLTAVKSHFIRYYETVYERSRKNVLVYKNSSEVLSNLKSREFRATSLSTYEFSTVHATLPHNLIKNILL